MFIKNISHVLILQFARQIHKIVKFYICKILLMQAKNFSLSFPWGFQVFPEIAKKQIFSRFSMIVATLL